MALAAFVLDYEKYISSVSIDRHGIESVEFSPDFYITGSDNISAKLSWKHILEQYQIITSMLISNVMCRSIVRNLHEPEYAHRKAILEVLGDYASDCQLEADEAEGLFDKHYVYLDRAYRSNRMHAAAKLLVEELSSHHTLSYSDLCGLMENI